MYTLVRDLQQVHWLLSGNAPGADPSPHCVSFSWCTCSCVALLCTVHALQVCDLEQAHQGPKVSDMLHYGDVAHMAPELVSEGHLTEVRQPCCG